MFAVKLNEKVYNFFNEIILCLFSQHKQSDERATIANKTNAPVAAAEAACTGLQRGRGKRVEQGGHQVERKTCMQLALAKEKSAKKILFRMQTKHVCKSMCVCSVCLSECVPVCVFAQLANEIWLKFYI